LAEMRRVTRPGGWIVLADVDHGSDLVDSPDRALTRRILDRACDLRAEGWRGRQLFRLAKAAGLQEVWVTPFTRISTRFSVAGPGEQRFGLQRVAEDAVAAGAATAEEVGGWLDQLAEASRRGQFFSALTAFVVRGRVP